MRRSAAPSVRAAKKMKFCTPFLAERKVDVETSSLADTDQVRHEYYRSGLIYDKIPGRYRSSRLILI